jgi:hypothetical protein
MSLIRETNTAKSEFMGGIASATNNKMHSLAGTKAVKSELYF